MQRRAFLKWLSASGAITALATVVAPAEVVAPAKADKPITLKGRSISAMTLFVAQRVEQILGRKLKHSERCDQMRHQFVSAELPSQMWHLPVRHFGELQLHTLETTARMIADVLKDATVFGVLPFPQWREAAVATSDGLAVRGIMDYSIQTDQYMVRFDVLCG